MSEQVTALDIWFSYSGKQQAFVESLVAALEDDSLCADAKAKAKAKAEIITKDLDHLGEIQLIPKLYARPDEDKESGKVYRLSPTENINKLVDEIASAFCKVLVITPDYFKSYVCLREMALTLSSFHIDKGFRPWLIWDESIEREVFSEKVERDFEIEEGNIVPSTLLKALQEVHESLSSKPIDSLASFDLSAERRQRFEEILLTFKDELYGNSSTPIPELAVLNYRYVLEQSAKLSSNKLNATLLGLFKVWNCSQEKPYLALLRESNSSDTFPLCACKTPDSASTFLRQLRGVLSANSTFYEKPKQKEEIMVLCGLILLGLESELDTSLMSHFYNINQLTSLTLPKNTKDEFEKAIHVTMNFSKATGAPIRVDHKQHTTANSIKGAIFPFRSGIDPASDAAIVSAFKALYSQLMGASGVHIPNDLASIREMVDLLEQTRRRLRQFEQDVEKRDYWSLYGGYYGFIVLDLSITQSSSAAFITKLEQLVNHGRSEGSPIIRIPKVLLKSEIADTAKSTYAFYLAGEIRNELLPIIQDIHTLIHT